MIDRDLAADAKQQATYRYLHTLAPILLSLLGGTIWAEIVFTRPGLGKLLVDAIAARDYPQIQGSLLAYIVLVIAVNLLVDLLYGVVDPRVSFA